MNIQHSRTTISCIATALLSFSMLIPTHAQADDCESGAQMATAIWKNWGDEIKKGGCATGVAVSAALTGGVTAPAAAEMYLECYATVTAYEEVAKKAITKWNDLVGNTWASLGPRALEANTKLSGTLVSTGGRVFISPAPLPANVDEVELSLKKTGGKGKTSVTICKVSANGKASQLWSFTIEAGDDNDGKTWSRSLKNLDGYVLSVHLDCKSVTKKLEYELTAKLKEKSAPTAKATVK